MRRELILLTGVIMTLFAVQASSHRQSGIVSSNRGEESDFDLLMKCGQLLKLTTKELPSSRYYLYLPRKITRPVRIMISVHGISRNAKEHARFFAPYAEAEGVVFMAPRFDHGNFPGYQRLAVKGADKQRADRALNAMVADLNTRLGLTPSKLYLFGYSGGGQFVHRYAMNHPERVERVVIGAAGWYTFPDPEMKYPLGLRSSARYPFAVKWPDFLRIPMTVVVGEHDSLRDDALNQNHRIDRQQGVNRLQRGGHWIEAMKQAAASQGYNTEYAFVLLPNTGHDFSQAMVHGSMGKIVFSHLFDETSLIESQPTAANRSLRDPTSDACRMNELVY